MAPQHPTPFSADAEKPSTARIYDYYLGGSDNYQADRDAAERMIAVVPESTAAVRANRDFLVRAVYFLAAEAGIDQFLDIGSGLPTRLNVHEVARKVVPDARVVYVDYDSAVRAYGDVLLATSGGVRFAEQDLREPGKILADPAVEELIDFSKPVAILLIAILPFIYDAENPDGIVAHLRQVMAPGSYLVISHILDEPRSRAIAATQRHSRTREWTPRTHSRIGSFFADFELVEPGLTIASQWRPASLPPELYQSPFTTVADEKLNWLLAGIGRKPTISD